MSNHSASFDLSQPTHEEDEDVEAELEKMSMPRQAAFVPGKFVAFLIIPLVIEGRGGWNNLYDRLEIE